jgi:hypothetical protein
MASVRFRGRLLPIGWIITGPIGCSSSIKGTPEGWPPIVGRPAAPKHEAEQAALWRWHGPNGEIRRLAGGKDGGPGPHRQWRSKIGDDFGTVRVTTRAPSNHLVTRGNEWPQMQSPHPSLLELPSPPPVRRTAPTNGDDMLPWSARSTMRFPEGSFPQLRVSLIPFTEQPADHQSTLRSILSPPAPLRDGASLGARRPHRAGPPAKVFQNRSRDRWLALSAPIPIPVPYPVPPSRGQSGVTVLYNRAPDICSRRHSHDGACRSVNPRMTASLRGGQLFSGVHGIPRHRATWIRRAAMRTRSGTELGKSARTNRGGARLPSVAGGLGRPKGSARGA